jgi:tRNA synthetases class I (C) catalytic domain
MSVEAGGVPRPPYPAPRVRVPPPLIRTRLPSGRGATEQPNATGDGDAALTPVFWLMVVLTGVAAGLFGDLMMLLLFSVQHLAFGYHAGSLEAAVSQASDARRLVVLLAAGAFGGAAWYLLRRFTPGERTEIDDVLQAAAGRAGEPYDRFAAMQQFYFERDMTALGVGRPSAEPRAHSHIGQFIALAAGLLAQGAAYERDGRVYFRGAAAARRAMPDEAAALRLAEEYGDHPDDPRKDDPFDVAVWQSAQPGEPACESPWGPGRPGWHAECAAMALHAFGPAIDVHAGGGDLRFPHHAYQAAMAEAFTGVTPFARARLNAGVVRVGGAKMAKSTGNLVLVSDVLAGYPAAAVRLLILDRRWDQDWDYSYAGLEEAAARLERL